MVAGGGESRVSGSEDLDFRPRFRLRVSPILVRVGWGSECGFGFGLEEDGNGGVECSAVLLKRERERRRRGKIGRAHV